MTAIESMHYHQRDLETRTGETREGPMSETGVVTAGLLVIGDEILSGRTKDKNIGYIAEYLTAIGIDLKEVRVIADDEAAIVEAVNALRARYTYLFTTGGIGPTHDDITADCVAKAFHESDLSDDALNAMVDKDEDYEASDADEKALTEISTETVAECMTPAAN